MKKRVLILLHQFEDDFLSSAFAIRYFKQQWEHLGFEVKVAYGVREKIKADIAINHVDLNNTPDEYIEYLKNYPIVINGKVTDISKTTFSHNIINRNDTYDGKVILKTNANCGGAKDLFISAKSHNKSKSVSKLRKKINRVIEKFTLRNVKTIRTDKYPIFESINDLPHGVWRNKHLVVEKFLPETDPEGNYRLRAWAFLGNKSLHVLTTSTNPVVKGRNIVKREILSDDIPKELIYYRDHLGFDYGRFDYAVVNNEVVLYDVNRTPTITQQAYDAYCHKVNDLARGIFCF